MTTGATLERTFPAVDARPSARTEPQPKYHVVLLDDNDHTYDYVIEMLSRLFYYPKERGYSLAKEVDVTGRVVVETTSLERAEFKRDQIIEYGADWRVFRSRSGMGAVIEPAVE